MSGSAESVSHRISIHEPVPVSDHQEAIDLENPTAGGYVELANNTFDRYIHILRRMRNLINVLSLGLLISSLDDNNIIRGVCLLSILLHTLIGCAEENRRLTKLRRMLYFGLRVMLVVVTFKYQDPVIGWILTALTLIVVENAATAYSPKFESWIHSDIQDLLMAISGIGYASCCAIIALNLDIPRHMKIFIVAAQALVLLSSVIIFLKLRLDPRLISVSVTLVSFFRDNAMKIMIYLTAIFSVGYTINSIVNLPSLR